ncbi:MAG: caspase family protein [Betaproteobacteria bacterium]|nr:caspase family protein [Betaproteobacteria bacterium]
MQPLAVLSPGVMSHGPRNSYPVRLTFSQDGQSLLIAYRDGWIVLWDVASRLPRTALHALKFPEESQVPFVDVALDAGGHAVVLDASGTLTVWDMDGSRLVRSERIAASHITGLARSDTGWWISSTEGAVLLDESYSLIARWPEARGPVAPQVGSDMAFGILDDGAFGRRSPRETVQLRSARSGAPAFDNLQFSRDGRTLLTRQSVAGKAPTLRAWNLEEGRPMATIREDVAADRYRTEPVISSDGEWIASSSDSGEVRLWRTASGESSSVPRLEGRAVTALGFDRESERLLVATLDVSTMRRLLGHADALAPSSMADLVVGTAEEDLKRAYREAMHGKAAQLHAFTLSTGHWTASVDIPAAVDQVVCCTVNGEVLLNGLHGEILTVPSGARRSLSTQTIWPGGEFFARNLDISADGSRIVRTRAEGEAVAWHIRAGRPVSIGSVWIDDIGSGSTAVWGVGPELWMADPSGGLRTRRLSDGKVIARWGLKDSDRRAVAVSNDGQMLLWNNDEGLMLVGPAGRVRLPIEGSGWTGWKSARFSPTGRHLLVCFPPRSILSLASKCHMFDRSGHELWRFENGRTVEPIFSMDSRHLFTVQYHPDGMSVSRLNLNTGVGVQLFELPANLDPRSWAMASDGREFLFGTDSGELVEIGATGLIKRRSQLGHYPVHALAVSPDGSTVLASLSVFAQHLRRTNLELLSTIVCDPCDAIRLSTDGRRALLEGKYSNDREALAARRTESEWVQNIVDLATGSVLSRQVGVFTVDGSIVASSNGTKEIVVRSLLDTGTISGPAYPLGEGVRQAAFLARTGLVATLDDVGSITLRDPVRARELRLLPVGAGGWLAIDEAGRFDASRLDDLQGVHWVTSASGRVTAEIDTFAEEFYTPGLLASVIDRQRLQAVPPIAQLNLSTPEISIQDIRREGGGLSVSVCARRMPSTDATQLRSLKVFIAGRLAARAFYDPPLTLADDAPVCQPFARLPVPPAQEKRSVPVVAYGFNSDGVRAEAARADLAVEASERLSRRAHILSIGIDAYANPYLSLRYAASDARKFLDETMRVLRPLGRYEAFSEELIVEPLPKQNGLASKTVILERIAALSTGTHQIAPQDLLVIYFAGHGLRSESGDFFLAASDFKLQGEQRREGDEGLISMRELADALLPISPEHAVIVIDACHSAANVSSFGVPPRPGDDRNLGQLAYDKRMLILAASQENELAFEHTRWNGAVMTYTLVDEALKDNRRLADHRPKDGKITVLEWLQYAQLRVPQLTKPSRRPQRDANATNVGIRTQHPVLFDFVSDLAEEVPLLARD